MPPNTTRQEYRARNHGASCSGGEGGGTAVAAGEEDKEGEVAAAAGEEGTEQESQKVVCRRGEDGWDIYSVACRVLHAVEFSAICFLKRIQQLKKELTTLRREWEEKAAEVATAAKKKE